uniref:Uncharacterized protein LOC105049541 isoform X2 n=1 Tax=Elaeis guineensis var. tenera TaxID=51953 RepID=A0A6I9RJB7_ELAGV|nr:uncharacterized protein LOC105049541 isoform X2 [Elaeis guineensis]XP_029121768.1 uncharacterized protein LOC105049541 isoform X2 [Elaeis guineensis]
MVGRPRILPSILLCHHFACLRLLGARSLSSTSNHHSNKLPPPAEAEARYDAYRQLQNLDFMTAAKILFTTPPKRKKFGLDFHLVQLFFVCMPSLAVYLVAQYARYEIRRMEAEVELKKKQAEEEEKAKEAEVSSVEEEPDSELSKVKVRLDALEEAVKGIVDEKRKISESNLSKDQKVGNIERVVSAGEKSDPQKVLKGGDSSTSRSREPSTNTGVDEEHKRCTRKVSDGETGSGEPKK